MTNSKPPDAPPAVTEKELLRARRKASAAARLTRRHEVWRLRTVEQQTQRTIAAAMGVSQPTILRDLRWSLDQFVAQYTDLVLQTQVEHVARLEAIANAAWEAWEASIGVQQVVSRNVRLPAEEVDPQDEAGEVTEEALSQAKITNVHTTAREEHGDSTYLRVIMTALSDIRKIMGADAPIAIKILTEKINPFEEMTTADLLKQVARQRGIILEMTEVQEGRYEVATES